MNKVELLAPAGNLEKLKIAYLYGADAVYVGGKKFSLRARASNFSLEDIKEASGFAQSLNRKLYITMNIIPQDEDLVGLDEYLNFLDEVKVTGIIVSSLFIAKRVKDLHLKLEIHLSTQASISNSKAIEYYQMLGFKRVVLAREVSLENIELISKTSPLEIEVFIHGGMCVSYSGRCMLSNYLTLRDANRGGCAHSCRWNYDIFEVASNKKKNRNEYVNIGSKDLNAINKVTKLIDAGVSSLKIEGRMKSLYYIACIVRTYRNLIDNYYEGTNIDYEYYNNEILKAENRLTSTGFLLTNKLNSITYNEQLYNTRTENPTKDFLGIVLDYNVETKEVTLEQRNYFCANEKVEFFGPELKNTTYQLNNIYDNNGNVLEYARHPLEIIKFKVPFALHKYDMMRKQ